MGISDRLTTAMNPAVTTRVLILDVERLAGKTEQYWFDRGDLQRQGRYISYESVTRMPRTTIVCAKFYDEAEVTCLAEWDKGGRRRFLRRVHSLISSCDVLAGHNILQADVPWLAGDLHLEANLPPLPPIRTIDTLRVLRQKFKSGAPFKSLDAICQILGLPGKSDRYDREAMERAVVERSIPDRERLTAYCAADVIASQGLLDWLLPHLPNPPTLRVDGKDPLTTCHRCGHDTEPTARRWIASVLSYSMRICTSCRSYSRISIEPERMSIVRPV